MRKWQSSYQEKKMKYKSFSSYFFCIHSRIYITWVEICRIQQVLRMHKEFISTVLPKSFLIYNLSSFRVLSVNFFNLSLCLCYHFNALSLSFISGMYPATISSFLWLIIQLPFKMINLVSVRECVTNINARHIHIQQW